MPAVLDNTDTPDLLGALTPRPRTALTPAELDVAITAIVDRQDVAGPNERAMLGRVRGELERDLADLLAE